MKKIHIYLPDGKVESRNVEKCPSLKELQEMVGGLIERTEVLFEGQVCDMIVNEEGLLKRLPWNQAATHLRINYLLLNNIDPQYGYIAGSVVIFEGFELE